MSIKPYSLTIRPRQENYDLYHKEWITKLKTKFDRKMTKYVIGKESGDDNESANHLQISLMTPQRHDALKRTLLTLLNFTPSDDDEARSWFVLKTHNDEKWCIAYCCKEGNYETNIVEDYIAECKVHYENKKKKISALKKTPEWQCTSINRLMPYVLKVSLENGLKGDFHILVRTLASMNKIPLSMAVKVKPVPYNAIYEGFLMSYEGHSMTEVHEHVTELSCSENNIL